MGHCTISFRLSVPLELRMVIEACRWAASPPFPFTCRGVGPFVASTGEGLPTLWPLTLPFNVAVEEWNPFWGERESALVGVAADWDIVGRASVEADEEFPFDEEW